MALPKNKAERAEKKEPITQKAEEKAAEVLVEEQQKEIKKTVSVSQPKKIENNRPKHSKKYLAAQENIQKSKSYALNDAIDLAKQSSYTKFEGSLDLHINTNSKNIRGLITLPFSSGKKLTILAFGKDAAESGADVIGDESTISDIQKGKLGFDVVITTPDWMPKLAKVAAILGPRGLMPNPKSGTITDNLKKAVSELQGGKTEYKTERNGQVIHLGIGKTAQPTDEIAQNIKVLVITLGKTRVKKLTLAPTMGPAVKIDLGSI